MPRVLVVTYQWLPLFNAGVKHVATLCRYLPSTGWEPHVLTKDWSEGPAEEDAWLGMSDQPIEASPALQNASTIPATRAPYALRDNRWLRRHERLESEASESGGLGARAIERRMLKAAYPFYGHYPDAHRGWVEPAVAAGLTAVRQYGIGAVLSVCPPATAHLVGGEIARRAGIAWVTMFADLSTFYVGSGDGRTRADRRRHRTLNRQWLQGASRAACTSPGMSEYVRDTYGIDGDVVVVPFDPEERRVPPHRATDAPLRVVHTGTIRPEADQPQVLFDALDQMLASGSMDAGAIRVDIVGSHCEGELAEILRDRACAPIVHLIENVSPAEAVRMQREADLLVVFKRQDSVALATNGAISYPAKIFEYLNALRPTIAIAADPSGFVGRLLSETNAGQTAEDAPSLAAVLTDYLTELRERGRVSFRGDEAAIARYSGPEQAKRLAVLLDAASAERFGSWQRA